MSRRHNPRVQVSGVPSPWWVDADAAIVLVASGKYDWSRDSSGAIAQDVKVIVWIGRPENTPYHKASARPSAVDPSRKVRPLHRADFAGITTESDLAAACGDAFPGMPILQSASYDRRSKGAGRPARRANG